MALSDLADWITAMSGARRTWYIKRLAANDTLATGGHQAGPYVPKDLLFAVFPGLNSPEARNPDVLFTARNDSHADEREVRAIWYNNRLHGGTRNEARITNWGGVSSPLLDPENTGAVALLAFSHRTEEPRLRVWVCRNLAEEDLAEETFGPVEPAVPVIRSDILLLPRPVLRPCRLAAAEIPPAWIERFPSGLELVRKSVELRPLQGISPDERLLQRRACEYEIFLSVEEAVEAPRIREGFDTVDSFVSRAQSILQRRKARSGRSLELHMLELLTETGLVAGRHFDHQPESEAGKRPDFLFPSARAYADPNTDPSKLRMLAAKTTCRDRWRQIINEADRISTKHLLTLQEGVSERQFAEMQNAGVQLVVPSPLLDRYPEQVRHNLVTLASFIADVRPSSRSSQ